jgi:hypothetical protein
VRLGAGSIAPQPRLLQDCRAVTDAGQRLNLMLDAATQPPRSRSLYAALAEAADDPMVKQGVEPGGLSAN